jgi:hypothetical protein
MSAMPDRPAPLPLKDDAAPYPGVRRILRLLLTAGYAAAGSPI